MKQKIIDNVSQYSAKQLVEYILQGVVTLEELINDTEGEFSVSTQKEVKHLLENGDSDAWQKAKQTRSISAVQHYLDTYPNGQFRHEARELKYVLQEEEKAKEQRVESDFAWMSIDKSNLHALQQFVRENPANDHVNEANKLINDLLLKDIMGVDSEALVVQIKKYQTDKNLTLAQKNTNVINSIKEFLNDSSKDSFLNVIREDHNLLSAGVIKRLIKEGTITLDDLMRIGIDKVFIQKMWNDEPVAGFASAPKLDKIHKQSTEIYFWGIPSSGKSCALGAILSVAANGTVARSMDPDIESQGHGYMMRLKDLFQSGQVGSLMEGNSLTSFYEMGFDLKDSDGKIHPITCIDMAGELMKCMFKASAKEDLSNEELAMLDTLTKVLIDNRTINRKLHIFVIEYGAEDRKYEGLPQGVYLQGALSYIKNTGIFKKDTDAIYVMVTKADKAKNLTRESLNQYISDKYQGFYNLLEDICKDNEINAGRVDKIAFSLGEVCFQNYCRFNPKPAENVVKLILTRSVSYRGGKLGKLGRLFRE